MIDLAYYKRINYEFSRRVGMIKCVDRLNALGLVPRNIIGTFWARDIPGLLKTCEGDSSLHIVTILHAGHKVNRYIEGQYKYRLAEGDNDPSLELILPPEVINHTLSELDHFIRRHGIGF